jgi:hypothetical protein
MLRGFEIPLDEGAVNHKLRGFVLDTAPPPRLDLALHWLETPLHAIDANRDRIHQAEVFRMFCEHGSEHAWDNVSKQELERGFGTDSGGNPPIGRRYRNQWFGSVPRCAIPGVSIVQRTLRPRYRQVWLIALEKRWCKMPTSCQILKATIRGVSRPPSVLLGS